ncbi:hypothetical protein QA639_21415 [Bradyrhizobium pachyrhizi]|uniref:hypothetical protein n=1 Tax=Bradyrhizobium pachyrhizi TaxID=280333 RepID=UPI0024B25156|nr:hypothetical protein [Bradyrhizobium pachyrhizi]WFU52270.1 hypothetical protein QA639_21415 [Bradyrhizobium pachyrhizi]
MDNILGFDPHELRRLLKLRDEIKRLQTRYPKQPARVLSELRWRTQISSWRSPTAANDDDVIRRTDP